MTAARRVLFDTSAVNRLNDDPLRPDLFERVVNELSVVVASHNLVGVVGTPSEERRKTLLGTLARLARHAAVLGVPDEILRRIACVHAGVSPQSSMSDNFLCELFRNVVSGSSAIDQASMDDIAAWRNQRRQQFPRNFRVVRERFDREFSTGTPRPTTIARWLRSCVRDPYRFHNLVSRLYHYFTGKDLAKADLVPFLSDSPEWRLALLSQAYATYERSIQEEYYGAGGKPGATDLEFAVYLPSVDYFVTADRGQRVALRHIRIAGAASCRILSFDQFRSLLLE
jgi:hypothetical protein